MQRRQLLKCFAMACPVGVALPAVAIGGEADVGQPGRCVRFAHLTDVHVQPRRSAPAGLRKAIKHVHALPDPPQLIVNGGDAIGDGLDVGREEMQLQWKLWHEAWSDYSATSVWNCLGNHDIWGWNQAKSKTRGDEKGWGKSYALEQFGLDKAYQRFDQSGWRFLLLDSMMFDPETAYRSELDAEQFEWLRGELADTPPSTFIVIISHIPILTVGAVGFAQELRKFPQGARMLSHQDAPELLKLLSQYPNVKLCLSGHTHLTEHVRFGGIGFVNSGAVSGLWWKGNFLHTQEGYNLIDLYNDGTYQANYVTYGWQADHR